MQLTQQCGLTPRFGSVRSVFRVSKTHNDRSSSFFSQRVLLPPLCTVVGSRALMRPVASHATNNSSSDKSTPLQRSSSSSQQPSQQQQPQKDAAPNSSSPSPVDQRGTSEGSDDTGQGFLNFLIRMKLGWLATFLDNYFGWFPAMFAIPKDTQHRDQHKMLRIIKLVILLFLVAGARRLVVSRKAPPREVLYSNFVQLLDGGLVRAARLESGTSRLYFDVHLDRMQQVQMQHRAAVAAAAAGSAGTAASEAAGWNPVTAVVVAHQAHQAQQAAMPKAPASGAANTAAAAQPAAPLVAPQAAASTSATSTPATSTAALVPAADATTSTPSALTPLPVPFPAAASSRAASIAPPQGAAYRLQRHYFIKLASTSDPDLVSRILDAGVEFAVLKAGALSSLVGTVLYSLQVWLPLSPVVLLVMRIMEGRTGKKPKANSNARSVETKFADVAGVETAKAELMEVVGVMKSAKAAYSRLKVKMPSGVLLAGPPGTGKTLLAKAVAGEAGVPFISTSASEFVELYVGRGAARVRELFAEARRVAPCVVFIDELDAVGSKRGGGHNDERDQTLNQLLTELDGFEGRPGVLFLAATNRPEVLDPALMRPGRLSRKVLVPLPDEAARAAILACHLRGAIMAGQAEREEAAARLAKVTAGFNGAELANVVNEAALLAARDDLEHISIRELLLGVQRTKFGVNGRTMGEGGKVLGSLQKWLLGVAAGPQPVKVASSL